MKTLVVGVGNSIRSDDGVGPWLVQKINQRNLPRVDILVSQQLHLELADKMGSYDRCVIVDAGLQEESIRFFEVQQSGEGATTSSHHVAAEFLMELSKKVFQSKASLFALTIKAVSFEFGQDLSPETNKNAEIAEQILLNFLEKEG